MAVGDAHMFPGFLTPVLTQISFESHQLLFSYASAEVIINNRSKKHQIEIDTFMTLLSNFSLNSF